MVLRRKPLTPARRLSRNVIWTVFAVIVIVRFGLLRDYYKEFHLKQQQEQVRSTRNQVGGGNWRGGGRNRDRRRSSDLPKPVSDVPTNVFRIHVEIEDKDVETLRGYHWSGWGGQGQKRPKVRGTVREGNTVYTNISLNLKGSAGSFRSIDDKPALTLRFSKYEKEQRFHGFTKVSVNNSVQDPTYMNEILSRELFEAAGVPVPRADHATVIVNGSDKNLYVLAEGFNEQFLSRYFNDVSGNLYDGGFLQDIDMPLDTNSGDNPDDRSDLKRLAEASNEPDAEERWSQLSRLLDMDRFITFLALEVMTCHWDGYSMNRNNYRVFHDMETDRMIFIPHGMDQMFGTRGRRAPPSSDIFPREVHGIVAYAVLTTPEGQERYLDRITELRKNLFKEDVLLKRIDELTEKIRPILEAYSPEIARRHDSDVTYLKQCIVERANSITEQLAGYREQIESRKKESAGVPQ